MQYYVGFDRDGTLFMPGVPTPERLIEQLKLLEAKGVTLFLASGKSHVQLVELNQEINFKPWLIAAENGAHIVIEEQGIEFMECMKHPHFQSFLNVVDDWDLPPHDPEPKQAIWSKKFHAHAAEAGEKLEGYIKAENWDLDVFVYPDGWGGVDVVPQGVDKVKLLDYIPGNVSIHYFGDGENDLGLMRDPRVMPHTMSNAKEVVKNCVSNRGGKISTEPAGLGVSEILNWLFGV